jgi:hypothetical protein
LSHPLKAPFPASRRAAPSPGPVRGPPKLLSGRPPPPPPPAARLRDWDDEAAAPAPTPASEPAADARAGAAARGDLPVGPEAGGDGSKDAGAAAGPPGHGRFLGIGLEWVVFRLTLLFAVAAVLLLAGLARSDCTCASAELGPSSGSGPATNSSGGR